MRQSGFCSPPSSTFPHRLSAKSRERGAKYCPLCPVWHRQPWACAIGLMLSSAAHGDGDDRDGREAPTPSRPSERVGCRFDFFLHHDHSFSPDEIEALVAAFEDTLRRLRLAQREDPVTLTVARLIVELAKQGERDP